MEELKKAINEMMNQADHKTLRLIWTVVDAMTRKEG